MCEAHLDLHSTSNPGHSPKQRTIPTTIPRPSGGSKPDPPNLDYGVDYRTRSRIYFLDPPRCLVMCAFEVGVTNYKCLGSILRVGPLLKQRARATRVGPHPIHDDEQCGQSIVYHTPLQPQNGRVYVCIFNASVFVYTGLKNIHCVFIYTYIGHRYNVNFTIANRVPTIKFRRTIPGNQYYKQY